MAVQLVTDVVSLPGDTVRRLLSAGSGDGALLCLCLAAGRSAESLHWPPRRLAEAEQVLVNLGLAQGGAAAVPAAAPAAAAPPEPDRPPEYGRAEIAAQIKEDALFSGLLDELQRRLGHVFSQSELQHLCTVYNYLALPPEVILLLTTWCIEETERKYGPARRPKMAEIQRAAFVWRRRGIDTAEAAETWLRREAGLRERGAHLLTLVGIQGRAPVSEERKYLDQWAELDLAEDAIRLAYEKTILKKGSMNWPYMTSILKNWAAKGLRTADDVRAGDSDRTGSPGAPAAARQVSDAEERERRARENVRWMQEFLARQRAEDGKEGDR